MSMTTNSEARDVILVGGGIMSVTLAVIIKQLQPDWTIEIIERMPELALESTNAWNNAGTGHAALCELNYTPEQADGSITITNALKVNEQFLVSRQLWSSLLKQGVIDDASEFINPVPHLSFVWGEKNVDYLRRRYDALKDHPLFQGMEYSEDYDQITAWAPLINAHRSRKERIAATYAPAGTDVNFGALTKLFGKYLAENGVTFSYERDVKNITKRNGVWELKSVGVGRIKYRHSAKFVFVGAGGGALRLLQKSGIKEIRGYGGFPVSGQFLMSRNQKLASQHTAKVYGRASVGAPPMSVPHLDTRYIDGEKVLLFGPYAGFTPKFLKFGSVFDIVASLRFRNLIPMISVGFQTLFDGLLGYLIREVFAKPADRMAALKEYYPEAKDEDWSLITAGQRVQVVKPDKKKGGVLQFGTEVIASPENGIAGILGASPGASTAASIMLQVLEQSFPEQLSQWRSKLQRLIPSYGIKLADDAKLAEMLIGETANALKISK